MNEVQDRMKFGGAESAEGRGAGRAEAGAIRIECRAEAVRVGAVLDRVEGVDCFLVRPGADGASLAEVRPRPGRDPREALFRAFAAAGLPLLELHRERANPSHASEDPGTRKGEAEPDPMESRGA